MFHSIIWDPPIGIDLGFFTIRFYSLMFLVAFISGWYLMKAIYKREGLSMDKLDKVLIYTVVGTLLGARLGHVIFYQPELFAQDFLSVFLPFQFVPTFKFTGFAGLASHGATIGIFIAMYFYSKKVLQKNIFWVLDRIVIPVSFGGVFVRIGNFLNSEIIGKPTHSDYGVVFKKLGEDFARHPSQLYESGCYLLLFFFLYYLYWKTNISKKIGMLFGIFFTLLWSIRFIVEFSKEPQVAERADWMFNTGQLLSLPLIVIGIVIMYVSQLKAKSNENIQA
ncbi:prolipoprotein diacylglyceryl transferase [Flavobacterium sp. CS20]|uniref:prolipoprotein diacylglyceryl transferase n=1 Tax=Flavobacterium sp. CS20 TaxID=2775246 RepID=UPI001B39FCE6|nr:prolipoprotein diacylglyceryl transferase [Flavobacterium sp. CS20]QTY27863.1 prolipoprotein diacylglyceryl transferase [Flavobacterium sp. CS20]